MSEPDFWDWIRRIVLEGGSSAENSGKNSGNAMPLNRRTEGNRDVDAESRTISLGSALDLAKTHTCIAEDLSVSATFKRMPRKNNHTEEKKQ